MNELLKYEGTDSREFKKVFLDYVNEKTFNYLFHELNKSKDDLLDCDEQFTIEKDNNKGNNMDCTGYNKMIFQTKYHVNLKSITVLCLQLLGEIYLQSILKQSSIKEQELPIIPTLIDIKKCINKLNEENGEFCIIKEIQYNKDFNGWDSFKVKHGECINNNIKCIYNQSGICKLEEIKLNNILKELESKKIITNRNSIYKINF